MFPIRDDNPHFLTPYTTIGLIVANVLSWVLLQGMGTEPGLSRSICQFGLIPGDLLGNLPENFRLQMGPATACVISPGGGIPTLFTSMFMHGGWFHIIGNLWFLWVFGNNVEDAMGHFRFLVFYLLSGLAAAAMQIGFSGNPAVPMVGASGAIGGVMGAYILLYPRVSVHMLVFLGFFVTTIAVPAVFMLGYWFLLQLLGGFTAIGREGGGVAFWAHVGGFLAGVILIPLFRNPQLLQRHPYYGWRKRSPKQWRKVR